MEKLSVSAAVILCFFVQQCKGVEVTLGDVNTRHFYGLNGESVLIQCVLSSGNFDTQQQRSWLANGVTLINSGVISSAGSGYSETFGSDRFGIRTPKLDKSFNGTNYKCFYGFDEANLLMNIAEIKGIKKSSGDCIKGISIDTCSFSLTNVIPEITQQNLTVLYKDDTVEDITSMLTVTSQVNADGSHAYQFKIIQVPGTISIDVKTLSLFFMVDIFPTTLNITMIPVGDCSQDIFLYGFLPVFLIVLIASIPINILKIDFLSKQFGEFAWKKVGITAVFCVIAIIIGVCLGLLIKGCDKKFLALGLSFLFGILLVVALIIVLIYYHKKCESKSGS